MARWIQVGVVFASMALGTAAFTQTATRPKTAATSTTQQGTFPAYPSDLKFEPGKEIKVDDPQTFKAGKDGAETDTTGNIKIYIPKDYDKDRSFPVILNFHGMNSDSNTWPFKPQTDGKGYVIVGMEYLKSALVQRDPNYEIAYTQRLLKWLKSNVNIDEKMVFMAGFSQGGWHTASICDKFAGSLAGIIITAAGRNANGPNIAAYKGMPVLIGAGENDGNRKSAESAAAYFKSQGAEVTLDIFPGVGHDIKVESAVMRQWFKDNGPARQSKGQFAEAEKSRKDGKLGAAHSLYTSIAKNPMAGEYKDKAEAAATEIAAAAQKILDNAEALVKDRKYPEARKALVPVMTTYAGSAFADTARQRIEFIDKDPVIAADSKQAALDARADTQEQMAKAAEEKKDYARAIALYESYVTTFPKSHRIEEVKKHLADLKADKTVAAAALNQAAEKEGKPVLESATTFITDGAPEKAKPILQELIKKYPDTDVATKAKALLSTIK